LLLYFSILRFNLTGETYLPDMVRYFPAASTMSFSEMIAAALFYNIIPLIVSFITYFFIYFGIEKLFREKSSISLLVTGFLLTLTTPIVYFVSGFEPFKYKASIWALILSFALSIATYYWFNKGGRHKFLVAI
jgi:fluoride ion exporter CrcB/FEX